MKKLISLFLILSILCSCLITVHADDTAPEKDPFADLLDPNSIVGTGVPQNNSPAQSRAIMQPYATVYSDPGLGSKVAQLKKNDLVQVLDYRDGNSIYVKYFIQSGEGTVSVDNGTNATYHENGDLVGTGYIDAKALKRTVYSKGSEEDKIADIEKDVVSLALSRLGSRGVYSQNRRYREWYTDCSALATFCWYQAGYDLSETSGCSDCDAIIAYGIDKGSVLWRAKTSGSDPDADERYAIPFGTYSYEDDQGNKRTCPSTDLRVTTWIFTPEVIDQMKPGDVIITAKRTTFTPTDPQSHFTVRAYLRHNWSGFICSNHAMIYIGSQGGSAQIVESAGPSNNAFQNTRVRALSANEYENIIMVVRPTGCEEITDQYGKVRTDYSDFFPTSFGGGDMFLINDEEVFMDQWISSLQSAVFGMTGLYPEKEDLEHMEVTLKNGVWIPKSDWENSLLEDIKKATGATPASVYASRYANAIENGQEFTVNGNKYQCTVKDILQEGVEMLEPGNSETTNFERKERPCPTTYGGGSYYSTTGGPCSCHHTGCDRYPANSWCTCVHYANYNGGSVYMGATQCFGWARYCQLITYGSHEEWGAQSGYFQTRYLGDLSTSSVKNAFLGCPPATHCRIGPNAHSISIMSTTADGVIYSEANFDGHCQIRSVQTSWEGFAAYLRSRPLGYYVVYTGHG